TLYQLLAGRVPHPAESLPEAIAKHMMQEPQLIESVRPDVPASLGAVVRKMMAKKPEERFQTPGDVALALAPYAVGVPPSGGSGLKPPEGGTLTGETVGPRQAPGTFSVPAVPQYEEVPSSSGRFLMGVLGCLVVVLLMVVAGLVGVMLARP